MSRDRLKKKREKLKKMAVLAFFMVTILWGLVGGLAPYMVPSGPQKVRFLHFLPILRFFAIFYDLFDVFVQKTDWCFLCWPFHRDLKSTAVTPNKGMQILHEKVVT